MEHSYTELRTRIQNKIDDLSNWLSTDIVLLNGEIAIVRLSGENDVRVKVGNGNDPFSELPYLNHSQLEELCSSLSLEISSSTLLSGVTYHDGLAYQLGSQSDKLLAPISSLYDLKGVVDDLSELLLEYALLSDTMLTEFSDWTFDSSDIKGFLSYDDGYWVFHSQDGSTTRTTNTDKYATTVEFSVGKFPYLFPVVATRERYSGYKLGSQSDKLLQPAGSYLSTSVFEDQISSVKDSLSALSAYADEISSEVFSLGGSLSNYVPLSGNTLVSNILSIETDLYVRDTSISDLISGGSSRVILREWF